MKKRLSNWLLSVFEPKFASIRKGFIRCGKEYVANGDRLEHLISRAKGADQRQARIEALLHDLIGTGRASSPRPTSEGAVQFPHELERQYTEALRRYYDYQSRFDDSMVQQEGPVTSSSGIRQSDYPNYPEQLGFVGRNVSLAQSINQAQAYSGLEAFGYPSGATLSPVQGAGGSTRLLASNESYRSNVVSTQPDSPYPPSDTPSQPW